VTYRTALFLLALSIALHSPVSATTAASCTEDTFPHWAVRYWEMPTGSENFTTGRELWPQSHPELGIDINSWVRIHIDTDCLQTIVGQDDALDPKLAQRLGLLTQGLQALQEAVDTTKATFDAYKKFKEKQQAPVPDAETDKEKKARKAKISQARKAFLKKAGEMGESVTTLLSSLRAVRQLRLEAEGLEPSVIAASQNVLFEKLLPRGGTYDWDAISDTLNDELRRAYLDEAKARADQQPHLLVRALLIGADGTHPIRLTGLNEVETGPFVAAGFQSLGFPAKDESKEVEEVKQEATGAQKKGTAVTTAAAMARAAAKPTDGQVSAEEKRALENAQGAAETAAKVLTDLPPGQVVPALADGPILTSFNLGTITQKRKAKDVVRVHYSVVRKKGDGFEKVGVDWEDNFTLRSFGLHQTISSGFSFVQRESTDDWKPTPVVNWTVDWRFRPGRQSAPQDDPRQDPGRRKLVSGNWFSGGGLSLLTPDFDDEQDLEVALGAQLSFVDHRITVGYGVNLSVDDNREFVYFSINVFQGDLFDKVAKLANGKK